MHTLILQKSNGLILQSRFDNSTGGKMAIDEVLSNYINDNNANAETIEIIEIPFVKLSLNVGQHIYNRSTGTVEQNPDYVEPARESESGIPTTDTSTGTTVNA
jgi:hypothetical protein